MMMFHDPADPAAAPVDPPLLDPSEVREGARVPRWRSEELMRGAREVEIEHAGAVYRLRITAMGRLILTK